MIFDDRTRIDVEVADTNRARARGLMFRDVLPEGAGLLLAMERPGYHSIWMKNVRIPLDILWLDAGGVIVWLVEWAPPCRQEPCPIYTPEATSTFVLEVPGGVAGRHRAAVGDALTLRLQ